VKSLVVFDFDDTLFYSGARIKVTHPGEKSKYLDTHEYAVYPPRPKDEFDYSEFGIYPPNPEPIAKTLKALRSAVFRHGIDDVVILTARGNAAPVEQVLENFGVPPIEIIAIGSSDPEDKADEVERMVAEKGYESVVLYEDSSPNIRAIRQRIEPLLGDKFIAHRVYSTDKGVRLKREGLTLDLRAAQKVSALFGLM